MFNPIKKANFPLVHGGAWGELHEWKIGLPPWRIGFLTAKAIQSSKILKCIEFNSNTNE
jgi:hypothetical protein